MDAARRDNDESLANILEDLREALARLDEADVPAGIGAHLSLAIERLKAHIEQGSE